MSGRARAGLVSVIIPIYNQSSLIQGCIESVVRQDYNEVELIVIDDGSTDQTPAVLERLAAQYSNVRLFTQVHLGSGAARESGRLNARGEFIQYLNCFERLGSSKLSSHVAALKSAPEVNVSCGLGAYEITSSKPSSLPSKHAFLFPSLLKARCWRTGAPLYRRSLIDRVGPWSDVKFDETWEYEARIALYGEAVLLIDDQLDSSKVYELSVARLRPLDPVLTLAESSRVQARIFQMAQRYAQDESSPSQITDKDWADYSDRLFELGRHCALKNMTTEARAMLTLSTTANDRKTPKQRLFLKLVGWFGWRVAARLFQR